MDIALQMQVGVLRVEPRDLQLPAGSPFSAEAAAFEGWFMDLILEDSHWRPNASCASLHRGLGLGFGFRGF